jgi:tetratricopeptide (TPR) repeat protein
MLAELADERGDLEVALDYAHTALHTAREGPVASRDISTLLKTKANILDSLGRLEEAFHLDVEWLALNPGKVGEYPAVLVRLATVHMDAGEDAKAEEYLRVVAGGFPEDYPELITNKSWEALFRPHTTLAELLERRGRRRRSRRRGR